jgi:hypothetical protein
MGGTLDGGQEQPDYLSYLLRLWRVNQGEEGWRASLESAHTAERMGFSSLDGLLDYLRCQVRGEPECPNGESEADSSEEGGDEAETGRSSKPESAAPVG